MQDSKVPSEYFLELLKKLVLPHHKIVKRGVDIYIPEICFFKDGESKGLFMNRELDVSVLGNEGFQYKEDSKEQCEPRTDPTHI